MDPTKLLINNMATHLRDNKNIYIPFFFHMIGYTIVMAKKQCTHNLVTGGVCIIYFLQRFFSPDLYNTTSGRGRTDDRRYWVNTAAMYKVFRDFYICTQNENTQRHKYTHNIYIIGHKYSHKFLISSL